jgi:glycosyltransferase involved in cell wall biosynthesis
MKVVHFSSIYIDGWGYQENLLPKYFKEDGHDVSVIALNKFLEKDLEKEISFNRYYIEGIEIIRIGTYFFLTSTLFFTKGLYRTLVKQNPDILFHHDIDFFSLMICVFYKSKHPKCKLFVDNHADMINKTKSSIWFAFYYKFILRIVTKLSSPFVEKFYGVTLGRCDFLEQVFDVNNSKIKLLPIGADTISADKITQSKKELKLKFNISIDNLVVISGGKMGVDKGTDLLIRAVEELNGRGMKISLVLFGSFNDELTQKLANNSKVVVVKGWCDRQSTLELLKMADIAVWPIHHTTLIEDSISCLTPLILRKTRTTEHLIDGNGIFIENGTVNEMKAAIVQITKTDSTYLNSSCKAMRDKIDYRNIVNAIVKDSSIKAM